MVSTQTVELGVLSPEGTEYVSQGWSEIRIEKCESNETPGMKGTIGVGRAIDRVCWKT